MALMSREQAIQAMKGSLSQLGLSEDALLSPGIYQEYFGSNGKGETEWKEVGLPQIIDSLRQVMRVAGDVPETRTALTNIEGGLSTRAAVAREKMTQAHSTEKKWNTIHDIRADVVAQLRQTQFPA